MNKSRKLISINEKYQIEIDEFNYALITRNKEGNMRKLVGYYPTLEYLFDDLYAYESKKRLMEFDRCGIEDIKKILQETKTWIKGIMKDLE